jgi:ribonuclease P protein component
MRFNKTTIDVEQKPPETKVDNLFIDTQVFPRTNRLTNAADYDAVFKQAQRSGDRFFTVLYCRNELGYPRLGLAIAKKRIRYAVARNRLKRIIRDSFRHAKNQLLGVDIVIMARDRTEQAVNEKLFASLEKHWRAVARANRIR